MGVPSYFFWLINRYKNSLLVSKIKTRPNALFLDLNCAIHPAVKANPDWSIPEMIEAVITYINNIISFVKKTDLVYLAIDGVAPMAKMRQQRLRRYKSKMFSEKSEKKPIHDFNMISPGTEFMRDLSIALKKTYSDSIISGHMILSDSDEPGEGEHKIFNYLRNNNIVDQTVIIYGLDSDLIFLSLINYCNEIYLLREKEQYGNLSQKKEPYIYLDINFLRKAIYTLLKTPVCYNINSIISDYVFISFFLGNDFLPSIPTLFIRDGGIPILLDGYIFVLNNLKEYLIIEGNINYTFLDEFTSYLAKREDESLILAEEARKKRISGKRHPEGYIEHLWQWPERVSWKKSHYLHHFDIKCKSEINKIVKAYLTSMTWCYNYYIGVPVSWDYCYFLNAAPAFSDFCDIKAGILPEISEIISPTEQLLYILPRSSLHLLPKEIYAKYESNPRIKILYPPEEEIKYCILNKKYLHEVVCYLPELNIKLIRKLFLE